MGTGKSIAEQEHMKKRYDELLQMMMPVYYIDKVMEDTTLALAKKSWNTIQTDTARHFNKMRREKPELEKYENCISYFNDIFFVRLFDVHPMAQVLFYKSNEKAEKQSQNKFLARMLTMALLDIDDQSRWDMTFTKLAEMHNEMGVKAVEYGIIGEILFWTIEQCIGPEAFTVDVHMAWIHVMSRILKTMVPVALRFELEKGSGEIQQMRSKLSEGLAEQLASRDSGEGADGPVNLMLYQSELNLIRIRKAAEGSINELQQQSMEKSNERIRKQEEDLEETRAMLAKQEEAAMERKLQETEEKMQQMMMRLENAKAALAKTGVRPAESAQ